MTHASEDRGPADLPDPDGPEDRAGSRSSAVKRRQLPVWQEILLLLGLALLLAVVIKSLFLQAFYIPSGSMNDTLVLNDRILVQKVSYWGSGEPERGDVVVFSDPGGWLGADQGSTATNPVSRTMEMFGLYPTGGHLVKRVVGVGGDRVVCCDVEGRITVNGVPLEEEAYLAAGQQPSLIEFDVEVTEGYLWVQGDNRSNSADSRVHLGDPGGGQVPADDVVGKVFAVIWPLEHGALLERPATFGDVDQ